VEGNHGKEYERNVYPISNLPNFFGCNCNKLNKKYYDGVENCIACKWAYDCKTWLGMHTPGKLPVKSRRRPRW
jgi:hypothetical protein